MRKTSHTHARKLKFIILISSVVFFLSVGLSILGLIRNSQGAVDRYNQLIAVDQAGGDVEASLNGLREYIHSHMNTEIGGPNGIYPPIQLSGTYDRLIAQEEARVQTINENLYTQAQTSCEEQISAGFSGRNRLDCINQYIDENGVEPQPIDDSLYKYDFVAPRWSPDLAGYSIVVAIISGIIMLVSVAYYIYIKRLISHIH